MDIEILIPYKNAHKRLAVTMQDSIYNCVKIKPFLLTNNDSQIVINYGLILNQHIQKSTSNVFVFQSYSNLPENYEIVYKTIIENQLPRPCFLGYELGNILIFDKSHYDKIINFTINCIGWEKLPIYQYFIDQFQKHDINVYNYNTMSKLNNLGLSTAYNSQNLLLPANINNSSYYVFLYPTQSITYHIPIVAAKIQQNIITGHNPISLLNMKSVKQYKKLGNIKSINSLTSSKSYWLLQFPYQFISSVHTQYNFENKIKTDFMLTPLITYNEYFILLLFILLHVENKEEINRICTISSIKENDLQKHEDGYILSGSNRFIYNNNTYDVILRHSYSHNYILDYHNESIRNKISKLKIDNITHNYIDSYIKLENYSSICQNIKDIDFFRIDPDDAYQNIYFYNLMGELSSEIYFIKIFCGIVIGLSTLKVGGVLSSIYFTNHPIYIELLCILRPLFDSVIVLKVPVSIYYMENHEILLQGFKGISKKELDKLLNIWKTLQDIEKDNMIDKSVEGIDSSYSRKVYYKSIFTVDKKIYNIITSKCEAFQKDMSSIRRYKYERLSDFIHIIEKADPEKQQNIIRYIREGQIAIALDLCKKYNLPIAPYYRERYKPTLINID